MRLVMMASLLMAGFVPAAEPIPNLSALIQAADASVLPIVVSHDPKHSSPPVDSPWQLGEYTPQIRREGPRIPPFRDPLDLADPRNAGNHTVGSAVVLDADSGLLLSCFHLVEGARRVYVRTPDGGSYANLHAADGRSDLAVLKLIHPTPGLKAIKMVTVRTHDVGTLKANVHRGDAIVSLAHPQAVGFSDSKPSASIGIISAISRKAQLPVGFEDVRPGYLYQYGSLLQSDSRVTLGCSGGAVLNSNGEMIGLTSAIAGLAGSDTAGGFALPMDDVYRRIVEVLRRGEEVEYGFLGVNPGQITRIGERIGLSVTGITPFGPAAKAGLLPSEVLVAVNGRPILDESDLFLLVGGSLAGNTVSLTVQSAGSQREIKPKLMKIDHPYPTLASVRPNPIHGLRVEYSSLMAVQQLGPGSRTQIALDGVIVRELVPNSPAERAFKQLPAANGRWLITHVNGSPVLTPTDFYALASGRQKLTLTVANAIDPRIAPRTIPLP